MKKSLTIKDVRARVNRVRVRDSKIRAQINCMKVRDDKRDVHLGDLLHVVCTRPEGFDLMHESDVQKNIARVPGPRKHKRRVYRVSLQEIY